jgi:4'-phosphopantetheinyl transferase
VKPETVFWQLQDFKNMPKGDSWLSLSEKEIQETLHFAKRRNEWRLGRWTVKKALQMHLSKPLDEIEVLPRKNGAPKLIINKNEYKLAFSISHRENKALCAFCEQLNAIGCDLEFIEPRSALFIRDYFTEDEKSHVRQYPEQKDMFANLIWSAKEAVAKVLQLGLMLDTRDVNVHSIQKSQENKWAVFQATLKNSRSFHGYWKKTANYLLTIAAEHPFATPTHI